MLQPSENKVKIEGILSEINLKYGSFMKNGTPTKTVGGVIKVRVDQLLPSGERQELEIPVHMFASELTNKGTSNPAYESIERVMNEYVSIAAAGIDAADRVRITNGSIQMNEYYSANGNFVSFPRVLTSFISKIKREDCKPEATFSIVFQVGSMNYKTDADGVEDHNCFEVKGAVPLYGGKVDIVPFVATSPNVINGVSSSWNQGDTVKANGRLNFTSKTVQTTVEVDFGEPQIETHTVSVSELVITGGSATPLEGEFAFNSAEIEEGLKERQNRLAENKTNAKNRGKSGSAPAPVNKFADLGF